MVDISEKLEKITLMIDRGMYFTINRARQYGKTTIMSRLYMTLQYKYIMIRGSLEDWGSEPYKSESKFAITFLNMLKKIIRFQDKELADYIDSIKEVAGFQELSDKITDICMKSEKDIVLMIDEVDKASSNIIMLDFLAMLRDKYNKQKDKIDKTFKSVILAGVHDIKNLKVHIRERRMLTEEEAILIDKTTYNSPWNVAQDFIIDLSFNPNEISSMLREYEKDFNTGMSIGELAQEIYKYTSGYPYLVSKLCEIIDERLDKDWSIQGIQEAIKIILKEKSTLFDELIKNLENNKELYNSIYNQLILGQDYIFNIDNPITNTGHIYGIFKEDDGKRLINNKIFEQRIYEYMSSKLDEREKMGAYNFRDNFIDEKGKLSITRILERFQIMMKEEYSNRDKEFLEREGRLLFIAFIRPIINGVGFALKEVQISQEQRLDILITYGTKKYVIELKKWYGQEYHQKGLGQLSKYLDNQGLKEGYLLIFNFKESKQYTKKWVEIEDKKIYEVVV